MDSCQVNVKLSHEKKAAFAHACISLGVKMQHILEASADRAVALVSGRLSRDMEKIERAMIESIRLKNLERR